MLLRRLRRTINFLALFLIGINLEQPEEDEVAREPSDDDEEEPDSVS